MRLYDAESRPHMVSILDHNFNFSELQGMLDPTATSSIFSRISQPSVLL